MNKYCMTIISLALLICMNATACKSAGSKAAAVASDSKGKAQTDRIEKQICMKGTFLEEDFPIEIALQFDDFTCAGYVLYPESLPNPPLVVGNWDFYHTDDEIGGFCHSITLTEYQPDGYVSATFQIELYETDDGEFEVGSAKRTYISQTEEVVNPTGELKITELSTEMPEWFPGTALVPDDYAGISANYRYIIQDVENYGEVILEKKGNNQMNFNIEDVREDGTYAQLYNAEGRSATLDGNVFEYKDANECGSSLIARFYKRFVTLVTRQVVQSDKTNCPYINQTFIKYNPTN